MKLIGKIEKRLKFEYRLDTIYTGNVTRVKIIQTGVLHARVFTEKISEIKARRRKINTFFRFAQNT